MTEEDAPIRPAGRWVSVRLQHRHVSFDEGFEPDEPLPDGDCADEGSLSYSGIVITGYDEGSKVSERWIPLGVDPSEADDERLIGQLRDALLWQAGRPPQVADD
ncbi:hypothetical protein SAMN05421837_11251 [Amycolatopsis pretoriensis]|uniref:Uncharacterized protein n=1 Tax=Amycolatopsis pretoriensis TaxID=218821 RepID=A0A1H5REZ9_9PSEU|nr:hypothetical protein [Amycolatopsis pretoriensis]SEF36940.1 hypothetical protein SAMN05421837_11251 [Amycolatopsis pretoriensis]